MSQWAQRVCGRSFGDGIPWPAVCLAVLGMVSWSGCTQPSAPARSSVVLGNHGPSPTAPLPVESEGKRWILAPPLKGQEPGDWYFLRARARFHTILFYQLCLRDRRTGDEGWALYERTVDDHDRAYPTIVLKRAVNQRAMMKELVGVMLTRAQLETHAATGLRLYVHGRSGAMKAWLQPAYIQGFLSLVDEAISRDDSR